MAINFSNGTNSTIISKPPRVITTYDSADGCPGTKAADLAQCTTTLVIARPAWVYVTGRMIRAFAGRTDLFLYASGPNGWSNSSLRARLNWTNPPSNNWDHVHLRYNSYLTTAGTYTFWIRGNSANTWGCGVTWGSLSIMTQEV
jgi:hypothetical protein